MYIYRDCLAVVYCAPRNIMHYSNSYCDSDGCRNSNGYSLVLLRHNSTLRSKVLNSENQDISKLTIKTY